MLKRLLRENLGYTFIELIIVISIIITLTALVVPGILNYQKSQSENEEVKNFISTLRTTQNLAITTDSLYVINFDSSNGVMKTCQSVQGSLSGCKEVTYKFIKPIIVNLININKYGNLVDNNGSLIASDEVTLSSPSYIVNINKFGRIYETKK